MSNPTMKERISIAKKEQAAKGQPNYINTQYMVQELVLNLARDLKKLGSRYGIEVIGSRDFLDDKETSTVGPDDLMRVTYNTLTQEETNNIK